MLKENGARRMFTFANNLPESLVLPLLNSQFVEPLFFKALSESGLAEMKPLFCVKLDKSKLGLDGTA